MILKIQRTRSIEAVRINTASYPRLQLPARIGLTAQDTRAVGSSQQHHFLFWVHSRNRSTAKGAVVENGPDRVGGHVKDKNHGRGFGDMVLHPLLCILMLWHGSNQKIPVR